MHPEKLDMNVALVAFVAVFPNPELLPVHVDAMPRLVLVAIVRRLGSFAAVSRLRAPAIHCLNRVHSPWHDSSLPFRRCTTAY